MSRRGHRVTVKVSIYDIVWKSLQYPPKQIKLYLYEHCNLFTLYNLQSQGQLEIESQLYKAAG